nr:PREDICTED: arf-GAP domain and FG repeat-containing protein 1-like isoform X4 [Bemisia tabaci]
MAAFTPEEMEFIKSRGNDYCRKVWLGLHSTDQPTKDELQIKDFMISKYEKKRYYVDPSVALSISGFDVKSNGSSSRYPPPRTVSSSPVISGTITAPLTTPSNTLQLRTTKITSSPVTNHPFIPNDDKSFYASNFRSALAPQDPFNSLANMAGDSVSSSEASFANFDKNPIFSSATQGFPNISTVGQTIDKTPKSAPPTEDRYAALKDLDSLMKTQQMTSSTPKSEPLASIGLNKNTSWYSSSGFVSSCTEPESTSSMPCNPFNKSAWSIPPHGQSSNGFPTSQSLNFPSTKAWIKTDSSVHSNPFVFSPGPKDAGHHSSNPFL